MSMTGSSGEEHSEAVDTLVSATEVFCDVARRLGTIIGDDALSVVTVEGFEGLGSVLAAKGELPLFEEYCTAFAKVDTWRQIIDPKDWFTLVTASMDDPGSDATP
jgi:hypothetical protein